MKIIKSQKQIKIEILVDLEFQLFGKLTEFRSESEQNEKIAKLLFEYVQSRQPILN